MSLGLVNNIRINRTLVGIGMSGTIISWPIETYTIIETYALSDEAMETLEELKNNNSNIK